jgi:hypothetical protein
MNTSEYISPETIIFKAAAMAGDKDYKILPKGFYVSLIQDAFRELNMDSFFDEQRADFDFPYDNLTHKLPSGCFNILNIYMYSGESCDFNETKKVWWKRNYFTRGRGFVANDKGNNGNDPFMQNHTDINAFADKSTIRYFGGDAVNNVLYYNVQLGNIMFSSSCRNAGTKVHIHYSGTGGDITEAEIIPVYFQQAIEDFTTEAALRYRIANEPSNARVWMPLQQMYERRLDKNGFNGSWAVALQRVRDMNTSQRDELAIYMRRGQWGSGL